MEGPVLQAFFCCLAIGYVPYGDDAHPAFPIIVGPSPNLKIEERAVFPYPRGLIGFFRPGSDLLLYQISVLWYYELHGGPADYLRYLVTEHVGEGPIGLEDHPLVIDEDALEG